jgi:hypothetical protein
MLAPKSQQTISYENMTKKILTLNQLSQSGLALQSAFREWDQDHRNIVIDEVRRILGNFAFASNFGIGCAFELLAIYIAHKEGWRDLGKEGY